MPKNNNNFQSFENDKRMLENYKKSLNVNQKNMDALSKKIQVKKDPQMQ